MHKRMMLLVMAAIPLLALPGCRNTWFDDDDQPRRERRADGRVVYESEGEQRLAQYRQNWARLLNQAEDEAGDYGDDWENLVNRMFGNLDRAEVDLRHLRRSGGSQWDQYQADWENLMEEIGDGFEEAQRRVRR